MQMTDIDYGFEMLCREPVFMLYELKNGDDIQDTAESLTELLCGKKATLLADEAVYRNYVSRPEEQLSFVKRIIYISADEAGASADDFVCRNAEDAVREALKYPEPVIAAVYEDSAVTIRKCGLILCKKAQRKQALAARRALTDAERREKSAAICKYLKGLPEMRTAKTVFSYMAAYDEADLSDFDDWARKNGKTVGYPVSYTGGIMEVFVPVDADSIVTGAYGIKAPDPERAVKILPGDIDIVLVPCVAFDDQGGRCGHGAGYYDRYLPLCKKAKAILTAFDVQKNRLLIQEPTDRKMDMCVTESGITGRCR